jgi:hypothetical protein
VRFATPVAPTMALMESRLTEAAGACARFAVPSRFIKPSYQGVIRCQAKFMSYYKFITYAIFVLIWPSFAA